MKRQWEVSRALVAQDDGQRRWDYVYQFLLSWMMEGTTGPEPATSHKQEGQNGSCTVCSRFDESATAGADD
jgi:hypothetical protein